MSTLKVNKLRDTAGSADAITLDPNGGAVLAGVTTMTTARVTSGIVTNTFIVGAGVTISESGIEASGIGITCANINGTQIGGRKNLIINGAMQIAQRATSYTGGGYETVDRFFVDLAGLDENPTQAQVDVSSGTTPYTLGFRKAYKITNGNQTSGAGAGDVIYIKQKIESRNVSNSGWNYTSASSFVTLQFWIKSSVAQTFTCHLSTEDGTTYIYNFDTGSLAANTWTKIVKTIPGNSNLEIGNDNGNGLAVVVNAFAGTNFTDSSTTYDTWTTYSTGIFGGKDNTSTWFTTNDATLEVTGFQLEVGPQATAFEHRSFGEELSLCQRYYYKSMQYGFTPQQAIPSTGQQDTDVDGYLGWVMYTSTSCRTPYFHHPVDMRTEPTVTIYSSGRVSSPTDNRLAIYNGSAWLDTATCSANVNAKKVGFNGTVSSALTVAGVYLMGGGFDCDAEL